ncbi:small ribosomal subunit protein uS3-like [Dipodomys merriami]|uniref:small ribosomal subunit protein uS3-like n=1 Tax=Dipodomys merriami TaxID=94247 RepID=UPI003855C641
MPRACSHTHAGFFQSFRRVGCSEPRGGSRPAEHRGEVWEGPAGRCCAWMRARREDQHPAPWRPPEPPERSREHPGPRGPPAGAGAASPLLAARGRAPGGLGPRPPRAPRPAPRALLPGDRTSSSK